MICPFCGANTPDGTQFCQSCGSALNGNQQQSYSQQSYNQQSYNQQSQKSNGIFVDPSEYVTATLTNGFAENIISGEGLVKENAYVTNKRVYYNARHGVLNVTDVKNVIDIPDITGTRIISMKHLGLLILGALLFVAGIIVGAASGELAAALPMLSAALVLVLTFFITMKKHLFIDYAGGHISFSVRKYTLQNVVDFQKAIYIQKDFLKR